MTHDHDVRRSPYYFKPPARERERKPQRRRPAAPRAPRGTDQIYELFRQRLEDAGFTVTRLKDLRQGGSVVRFSVNGRACVGHRTKKPFFPRKGGAGYYRSEVPTSAPANEIHLFLVGPDDGQTWLYVMPCVPGKHHFPHKPHGSSRYEEFRDNLALLT